MDTISAGMTIAFACECYEKGIIGKEDTGGLDLQFGDADLMLQLLEMIARREGFGDQLAEGSARLAKKWNVEDQDFNLTVKGQELSLHDPRVKVGVGMGFAISPYGADHMTAAHDTMFRCRIVPSKISKTPGDLRRHACHRHHYRQSQKLHEA